MNERPVTCSRDAKRERLVTASEPPCTVTVLSAVSWRMLRLPTADGRVELGHREVEGREGGNPSAFDSAWFACCTPGP